MPHADPPGTDRLQLAAALLAASVLGAPLVIAGAASVVLGDQATWIAVALTFLVGFAGAMVAVGLVLARLARRSDAREVLRLPYMILLVQLVFGALAGAMFVLSVIGSTR